MEFQLSNGLEDYQEGTNILLTNQGHTLGKTGILIQVNSSDAPTLSVHYEDHQLKIQCQKKTHYFRGLGLFLQHLRENPIKADLSFQTIEQVWFESNGTMLDCSRNAVLTIDAIKKYIRYSASLGLNTLMIYTEDTYEVPEYPYFGAYRGRYTKDELKECDDYAYQFGIEIIPCIQTLAHLHTALRWQDFNGLKDTEDILLVGNEKVYALIKAMIKAASAPFRSKRIHLGMDEAHELGLGQYLSINGYNDRFHIMNSHLDEVNDICKELDLYPMLWSDMYFRLRSKTGDYYDLDWNSDLTTSERPPKNIGLVYWDYYNIDIEHYKAYINLHKQLSDQLIFAAGGWTWNGIAPNYSKAFATMNAGLTACKDTGIDTVTCTFWQDNGAETPLEAGLPSLVYFAEHGFSKQIDMDQVKSRFQYLTHKNFDDYMILDQIDHTQGTLPNNINADNPSKYLLYQDVLLGMFDENIKGLHLSQHYENLAEKLSHAIEDASDQSDLLGYYRVLCQLLAHKSELGIVLFDAYHGNDRKTLEHVTNQVLPLCIELSEELKDRVETLWFKECKPFGYEIIDIRFNGVQTRLKSSKKRLDHYLAGTIKSLPELEEKRLPYQQDDENEDHKLCSCNTWQYIISAGNIAGI